MSRKYSISTRLSLLIFLSLPPSISNAAYNIIDISKEDLEKYAQEYNYNRIENCDSLDQSFCRTILGGAHYWKIDFKDKKIIEDDTIARLYLQEALVDSITARKLVGYILSEERPKEGYALISSAAYEGNINAIYTLGHTSEVHADKDILERIKWRKILLSKDSEFAKDEYGYIGNFYLRLTTPDYPNAIYWLKKAVIEEDDMSAQLDIAQLYAQGKGVEQDLVTAYMYYDLSGSQGSDGKSSIAASMTPAQINEAIARSHQWQDEHQSYRPGYGAWNDMGGGIEWHVH